MCVLFAKPFYPPAGDDLLRAPGSRIYTYVCKDTRYCRRADNLSVALALSLSPRRKINYCRLSVASSSPGIIYE